MPDESPVRLVRGPNAGLWARQKRTIEFADRTVAAAPWVLGATLLALGGSVSELEPAITQYVVAGSLGVIIVLIPLYGWARWYASRFK